MLGQITIVGEQDQSLGLGVEASDVEEPLGALRDQVTDAWPAALIAHGRHHAERLVHRKDKCLLGGGDPLPVDVDRVTVGIDPHALLAHDTAIDAHAALIDQLLAGSPTSHSGLREHLLQTDAGRIVTAHDSP